MTPADDRLFEQLEEAFGVELAQAYREAIADLKANIDFAALEQALANRDADAAMDALNIEDAAFYGLWLKFREGFVKSAVLAILLSGIKAFRFDPRSARVLALLDNMSGQAVAMLVATERTLARQFIEEAIANGQKPRTTINWLAGRMTRKGRRIGGLMGLSATQRRSVRTARAELSSGQRADILSYLQRKQRDISLDRKITRATRAGEPVDIETIQSAATGLETNLLDTRAAAVALVAGLAMLSAGRREALQQLVEANRLEESVFERTWLSVGDDRVRHAHRAMHGQKVNGLSMPFISPTGAMLMHPRDTSLGAGSHDVQGCRCRETITIRR